MTSKSPSSSNVEKSRALLSHVYISDTVVHSCFSHAFTTEKEEVMGMLLGDVFLDPDAPPAKHVGANNTHVEDGSKVARVWSSFVMRRNVQRSDRVEVAVETLIEASEEAERLTAATGVKTRVIGWYHSHPRITPHPSQVDLNTQRTYQQMESGWVGLIFSLFNSDSTHRSDCAIHAFQTGAGERHVKVPISVAPQSELGLKANTIHDDGNTELSRTLQREADLAVSDVGDVTQNDPLSLAAAQGLRLAHLGAVQRLVLEPSAKQLQWCTIPALEAEVERLEREIAALS